MRDYYIVAYDISDQKRWRQVYRKMQGYGNALQYSVFMCDISMMEKAMMMGELQRIIVQSEDRIMFVKLSGEDPTERIEFIGKKVTIPLRQATII